MIPLQLRPLFWDTNLDAFEPKEYPVYTIERVLEHGDEPEVTWLLDVFTREQVREVIRTDRRLTPRSASFWALFFGIPTTEVAALVAVR